MRQTDPHWTDATGHRINLQFAFGTPAEVDAAHVKLTTAGHASYTAPRDAFWGRRFARVVDPDGNVVNLYAQLPEKA